MLQALSDFSQVCLQLREPNLIPSPFSLPKPKGRKYSDLGSIPLILKVPLEVASGEGLLALAQ